MTLLPAIILVPFLALIVEAIIVVLKSKYDGIIPLISSMTCVALSIYFIFNPQGPLTIPWINAWDINFSLAINDVSIIFLILVSLMFLVINVLALNTKEYGVYWCMILLLHVAVSTFILSQNIVIKVMSWELIWLPIFVILINTDKKHYSIKFSNIWFIAQLSLISGVVIIAGKFNQFRETAFWLLLAGTMLRSYLFPFDGTMKKLSEGFAPSVSILTTVVLPLIPIIFLTTTIVPLFQDLVLANTMAIAIFICANILIWIFRLLASKTTSMLSASNILIFNCLILIWSLDPNVESIQFCIQIIVAKMLINIALVYYGNKINKPINKWAFISVTIMSFGFFGVIIGLPITKLFSIWNASQQSVAVMMFSLLFLFFTATAVKMGKLFNGGQKCS